MTIQKVEEKDLSPEQKEAVDKVLDKIITIKVIHKGTLESAEKTLKLRHVTAFSKAVVESFRKRFPDTPCTESDFLIVYVNFELQTIDVLHIG